MPIDPEYRIIVEVDSTLSIQEIWPDGDAPSDSPTAQDVVKVIKECGDITSVIKDWNLQNISWRVEKVEYTKHVTTADGI